MGVVIHKFDVKGLAKSTIHATERVSFVSNATGKLEFGRFQIL